MTRDSVITPKEANRLSYHELLKNFDPQVSEHCFMGDVEKRGKIKGFSCMPSKWKSRSLIIKAGFLFRFRTKHGQFERKRNPRSLG